MDLATYIETALTEVCFGCEDSHPLEATIDRYFTPDYQQRTDGELVDRDGFAAHIKVLRGLVTTARSKSSRRFATATGSPTVTGSA